MIDHKLARKLKKVGFPQREDLLVCSGEIEEEEYRRDVAVKFQRHGLGYHKTFDLSLIGYPKTKKDYYEQGKYRCSSIFSKEYLESEEGKEETVYFPVLSELIEECLKKDTNFRLHCYSHGFVIEASSQLEDMRICKLADVAVAKLYIELNK